MNNKNIMFGLLILLAGMYSCSTQTGQPVEQTSLPRIDQMPAVPQPLNIIDWRQKTLQYDSIAFDLDNKSVYGPVSYTHLGVYKRQNLDRNQGIRRIPLQYDHQAGDWSVYYPYTPWNYSQRRYPVLVGYFYGPHLGRFQQRHF